MKEKYLKIVLILVLFITIVGLKNRVKANSIDSIDMDIYVDNNGDAEVTEVWKCYVDQGTDCYHPYFNLGNSQITNFRVSDLTTTYIVQNTWNTNGTMNEKAYKCGINNVYNGVELCWGISKYGSNVYTAKYNISNFVSELTDSQMIYWTLIPHDFSNPIGSMKIKIHADKYFEDTTDVWGYGNYGGLCYVKDGTIYMQSNGALEKTEYMTLLAKFKKETFNTSNFLDNSFEYYFNLAENDAIKYEKNDEYMNEKEKEEDKKENLVIVLSIVFIAVTYYIARLVKRINASRNAFVKNNKLNISKKEIKTVKKDIKYFRDIPLNGDILEAYYIAYKYKIIKYKMDILGAIILMWLRDGKVKIDSINEEISLSKKNIVLVFEDPEKINFGNQEIHSLYNLMYTASKDGILERKEFKEWCGNNISALSYWFDSILKWQESRLIEDGLIVVEKSKEGNKYFSTPLLNEKAGEISGFKKFLLDYTSIKDREVLEISLFEDYLIYAQLLGVAEQVSKQFSEIYPKMVEDTNYDSYSNIIGIDYYVPTETYGGSIERYNEYRKNGIYSSKSDYDSANDYDSGGGGFSSGGGGEGSFGGGGGRRRFPLNLN